MFTDSKSLFDIIANGTRPSKNRLVIDGYPARQRKLEKEILNISIVRSDENPAECLAIAMKQKVFRYIIKKIALSVVVKQWILRQPTPQYAIHDKNKHAKSCS